MYAVGDRVQVVNGIGHGVADNGFISTIARADAGFTARPYVLADTPPSGWNWYGADELALYVDPPTPDTNSHDYHLGYHTGYHFTKRMLPTLAGGKSANYVAGFRAGLDYQHAEAVTASEAQLTRDVPVVASDAGCWGTATNPR